MEKCSFDLNVVQNLRFIARLASSPGGRKQRGRLGKGLVLAPDLVLRLLDAAPVLIGLRLRSATSRAAATPAAL